MFSHIRIHVNTIGAKKNKGKKVRGGNRGLYKEKVWLWNFGYSSKGYTNNALFPWIYSIYVVLMTKQYKDIVVVYIFCSFPPLLWSEPALFLSLIYIIRIYQKSTCTNSVISTTSKNHLWVWVLHLLQSIIHCLANCTRVCPYHHSFTNNYLTPFASFFFLFNLSD